MAINDLRLATKDIVKKFKKHGFTCPLCSSFYQLPGGTIKCQRGHTPGRKSRCDEFSLGNSFYERSANATKPKVQAKVRPA